MNSYTPPHPPTADVGPATSERVAKARSAKGAIALAALLIFFDAFVLNQGAIAFLVAAWLVLVQLPRSFLPKFTAVRLQRLRNICVYLVAVSLVFILNYANNQLARNRADTLVTAVKAFHSERGKYPGNLQELVPGFTTSVPVAKYTLGFSRFYYYRDNDGLASLYYVDFPPFGRPTYSFSRNDWTYLD